MREENTLVSIIIPVYNVEKYLDKSVSSAVEQTYERIEIILVDDGSQDNSGELCELWKSRDDRVRVIHKENGGLSSARNAALDIAEGEYFYFLDSDDYIDKDTIKVLVRDAITTGAQIVEAPFMHVYENRTKCRSKLKELKVMNTPEAIRFDLAAEGGSVSSCSKLFIRDIFESYRFAEGKLNEDHFSIVEILSKAKIIAIEPKPLYYYMHRKNSITTTSFSDRSLDDLEAAQKNYRLIRDSYPQVIDVAEFRIDFSILKIIDKMMLSEKIENTDLLGNLVNDVRKNKKRILRSCYFSPARKMSLIILLFNKKVYRYFVKRNAIKSWSA